MDEGACVPIRVHTVVISVQHDEDISLEEQRKQLKEEIIKVCVCVEVVRLCGSDEVHGGVVSGEKPE